MKLIAPQFVKPYVKSNKNDTNDAEAICEAMSRPSMRFVSVKTIEQQNIQATHRIRAGLIEQRTAKANQIRGLVAEYGMIAPQELLQLRRAIACWPEDASNGLTTRFRHLLDGLWSQIRDAYNAGFTDGVAKAKTIPVCAPLKDRDVYFNAMFSDSMSGAKSTSYQKSPAWLHSVGFSYLSRPTMHHFLPDLDFAKIATQGYSYPRDQVKAVGEMAGMVSIRSCATDDELKALAGPKLMHLEHRSLPHIG